MKLWLDDMRPMPKDYDVHATCAHVAIELLGSGAFTCISFDHDLGEEEDGYTVAKWCEEKAESGELKVLTWSVHSANPVGRGRIEAAMRNADKYWSVVR